jgi:DNA modification methylase
VFETEHHGGDKVAHPTVKPLELMRWLVRLVTPPGGTVLEPFAGSGTTVEACLTQGFRCVAIEREADYLPLILQRIHRRQLPAEEVADPPTSATPKPLDEPAPEPVPGQLGLFTEDVA